MAAGPFHYGGQAVIEGVMIRGQKAVSIAARRPDGELALHTEPLGAIYTGRVREMPLLRGVLTLVETLVLGIRSLIYSTNVSLGEDEQQITPGMVWGMLAFALAFAVAIFFVLPLLLTTWLDAYISSSILSNAVEGVLRLSLFVLYVKAIGLLPDIRRLFAYHGAEHKTINAYEDGEAMEVSAVRKYSTSHARCGTAFLLIVFIIAFMVFALLGRPPLWLRIASRIVLIPVIAGIGYELMRFSAAHMANALVRVIFAPGLALQALTTGEPDEGQLEVALHALKGVLAADGIEASGARGQIEEVSDGQESSLPSASQLLPHGLGREATGGEQDQAVKP